MAFFNLKQYQKAIGDCDKVVSLDPQDYAALNDRGIAKMQLNRNYDAIRDIGAAIRLRKQENGAYSAVKRADAYLKSNQLNLAIPDLTTAISLQVGASVLLMGVSPVRSIRNIDRHQTRRYVRRSIARSRRIVTALHGNSKRLLATAKLERTLARLWSDLARAGMHASARAPCQIAKEASRLRGSRKPMS